MPLLPAAVTLWWRRVAVVVAAAVLEPDQILAEIIRISSRLLPWNVRVHADPTTHDHTHITCPLTATPVLPPLLQEGMLYFSIWLIRSLSTLLRFNWIQFRSFAQLTKVIVMIITGMGHIWIPVEAWLVQQDSTHLRLSSAVHRVWPSRVQQQ